jgi:hypothetical protein
MQKKENKKTILKKKIKLVKIIKKCLQKFEPNKKLKNYNCGDKIHLKQLEFHKCKKRNRWVFGGNRSGKTECGAVETVWYARGIHPFKENKVRNGWVVSLSQQVQRDVAQSKILSYEFKNCDIDRIEGANA